MDGRPCAQGAGIEGPAIEGRVAAIEGAGRAVVRVERTDACGHCRACIRIGPSAMTAVARNPLGARVGQRVLLSMPSGGLAAAAVMLFLAPLLCVFAGAALGWLLGPAGALWPAGVGAGAFLLVYLLLLARYDRSRGRLYEPTITEILSD